MPLVHSLRNWEGVLRFLKRNDCPSSTVVVMEKVGHQPTDGGKSSFSFGRSVGMIEGVLSALGYPEPVRVSAQSWQNWYRRKGFDIPTEKVAYTARKESLRKIAKQVQPSLRTWNGSLMYQRAVCDAILLLDYELLRDRVVDRVIQGRRCLGTGHLIADYSELDALVTTLYKENPRQKITLDMAGVSCPSVSELRRLITIWISLYDSISSFRNKFRITGLDTQTEKSLSFRVGLG